MYLYSLCSCVHLAQESHGALSHWHSWSSKIEMNVVLLHSASLANRCLFLAEDVVVKPQKKEGNFCSLLYFQFVFIKWKSKKVQKFKL